MTVLHAPTLRHVIEMLDERAVEYEKDGELWRGLGIYYVSDRNLASASTLRAFRERLEREAVRAEADNG